MLQECVDRLTRGECLLEGEDKDPEGHQCVWTSSTPTDEEGRATDTNGDQTSDGFQLPEQEKGSMDFMVGDPFMPEELGKCTVQGNPPTPVPDSTQSPGDLPLNPLLLPGQTHEAGAEEIDKEVLVAGSNAICNGDPHGHACGDTMSVVVGVMGHGFGSPIGFDYSMGSCGVLFSKSLTKRFGLFQDLHEVAEDTEEHRTKEAARDTAARTMKDQTMNDQLQRNSENLQQGRCNPSCAKIDMLHSLAFSLPGGVGKFVMAATARFASVGLASEGVSSSTSDLEHHVHHHRELSCHKLQWAIHEWKAKMKTSKPNAGTGSEAGGDTGSGTGSEASGGTGSDTGSDASDSQDAGATDLEWTNVEELEDVERKYTAHCVHPKHTIHDDSKVTAGEIDRITQSVLRDSHKLGSNLDGNEGTFDSKSTNHGGISTLNLLELKKKGTPATEEFDPRVPGGTTDTPTAPDPHNPEQPPETPGEAEAEAKEEGHEEGVEHSLDPMFETVVLCGPVWHAGEKFTPIAQGI